ncbi:hypothetical protein ACFOG5_10915 [Pedobacter fastidiosus]
MYLKISIILRNYLYFERLIVVWKHEPRQQAVVHIFTYNLK